jgi:regulator of nucleoside diphosphate kinase
MIDSEADALTDLAIGVERRMPQVSELLLREIGRATIHKERHVPRDVVTMNSEVDFVDAANGAVRSVRLVYPSDADIATGRISILTPVGAGLIGLRTGSAILWPTATGRNARSPSVQSCSRRARLDLPGAKQPPDFSDGCDAPLPTALKIRRRATGSRSVRPC